jgi:hypothetical protein
MKITEGQFWLLEFNCGAGSSSAAFINISASNERAPVMHVYAVDDSNLVMVEATQRRLSAAQFLLLNGTPVVGTAVVGKLGNPKKSLLEDSNIAKGDNENTPLALTGLGTDEVVGDSPITITKKRKSEISTIAEEKKKKPKLGASTANISSDTKLAPMITETEF